MDNNYSSLGIFFKQQRVQQGVSRADLAMRLAISEKTIQRIEQDQVDMKTSQLLAFLNCFGMTAAQVAAPGPDELSLTAVTDRLRLAGQGDTGANLDQLETALTEMPHKMQPLWVKCAIRVTQIRRYALSGDDDKATKLADVLCERLVARDVILPADFELFSIIVNHVAFAQLRTFISKGHVSALQAADVSEAALDRFFGGLLDSALMTKQAKLVREAIELVQLRQAPAADTSARIDQHLTAAMAAWLDGDDNSALQQKQQLIQALRLLMAPTVANAFEGLIQKRWAVLRHLPRPTTGPLTRGQFRPRGNAQTQPVQYHTAGLNEH